MFAVDLDWFYICCVLSKSLRTCYMLAKILQLCSKQMEVETLGLEGVVLDGFYISL